VQESRSFLNSVHQVPSLRKGLDAMMQAAKAHAFELWTPKGALSLELKKRPSFPVLLLSEAFSDNIISYSWNRKASAMLLLKHKCKCYPP
jgi:hypothetical protein